MKSLRQWSWLAWPLGAFAFAAAIAWMAAPNAVAVEAAWLRNWTETETRQLTAKMFGLRDSSDTYFTAWQLADTRERAARETAVPIGLTIKVDPELPAVAAKRYRDAITSEWNHLVAEPHARVLVRLIVDTADAQAWRAVMIPVDTNGTCTVYLRVRGGAAATPPPAIEPHEADSLTERSARGRSRLAGVQRSQRLGVCGLYGRFGYPGRGMREWLTRTQLRTAGQHTADPFAPPVQDAALRRGFDRYFYLDALACSVGTLVACSQFLEGAPMIEMSWRPFRDDALLPPRRLTNGQRIATYGINTADWTFTTSRLAALRATVGDDRFEVLWRAEADPATTFRQREGAPIEELISTSLRSKTYRYVRGNGARGLSLVVVLGLIAVALALSLRFTKRAYRAPV